MKKQAIHLVCVSGALWAVLWLQGCAPRARPEPALADLFQVASGELQESFAAHQEVIRNGRRKDAMRLIAPLRIRLDLDGLPRRFKLAMRVTPVFNIGDGMQLDFLVGNAGDRRRVAGRYFDAGRIAADRDWTLLDVPVDSMGAEDAYLEISLSGGPQGDLVADWLAIADLDIVHVDGSGSEGLESGTERGSMPGSNGKNFP